MVIEIIWTFAFAVDFQAFTNFVQKWHFGAKYAEKRMKYF